VWVCGDIDGCVAVEVVMVEASVFLGATDWKMWMGSASKNSWAMTNGVTSGSVKSSQ